MAPSRKPGTNHNYADGKNCYCEDCKAKNRGRMKRRYDSEEGLRAKQRIRINDYRRRRSAMLAEIKLQRGCEECGYNEHPAALDFAHRDQATKAFSIGTSVKRKWEDVLAEVVKCRVLCANCHRVETAENGHHRYRKSN